MKSIFQISLLLFFFNAYTQNFELGKVSIEELTQKYNPHDSLADAAILYAKCTNSFEHRNWWYNITTVEMRIKFYNKKGYQWANKQVGYYNYGKTGEEVEFSNAVTYNLTDGKIVKTQLGPEGIFTEKLNKYTQVKKIAMPDVREGSVIEYKYIITTPSPSIRDWSFQSGIPVNYSEFITKIPDVYTYNITFRGSFIPEVKKQKINSSFSGNMVTYIERNLPAMRQEKFINNIENYISSISHELSMVSFPGEMSRQFSTDWDQVTKRIYESDDFGGELQKNGYYENDVKNLTANLTTDADKTAAIVKFLKSQVKCNNNYTVFCSNGVMSAYKSKIGNVAEINLMLISMLRYVGIDANPVLISTRSNGIPVYPSLSAFNYVICGVEVKDDVILIDAADEHSVPGILPLHDLNWNGRLIRKNGSSAEVNLIPKIVSRQQIFMNYTIDSAGEISGKIKNQLTDYMGFSFRHENQNKTNDAYLELLEDKDKIEINDYKRENDNIDEKPIVETYDFKLSKSVDKIADKLYIDPLLFLTERENPFKEKEREYPIDFGFPVNYRYKISINIPDGYAVESMPQEVNLATKNGECGFKYLILNEDNKIQIDISQDMNEAIVPSLNYSMLQDFFQKMIEKQTEKIVLRKV